MEDNEKLQLDVSVDEYLISFLIQDHTLKLRISALEQ
jgi:hypothetical protein